MSLPYMPLWVGDYLKDTRHLTTEEHGAYLLLIMEYWQKGGLQDDDVLLARIVGMPLQKWMKLRHVVQSLFTDGWQHKRIDTELAKAASKTNKRRKAANTRWDKEKIVGFRRISEAAE